MKSVVNEIKESFSLLSEIEKDNSRNGKKDILLKGKDNAVFKSLLYLTYNNLLIFNIKQIPKVLVSNTGTSEEKYRSFTSLLEKLNQRTITGNAAKDELAKFLSSCNDEEFKWYSKVISKDFKIGITEKTINDVFPNLIPEFTCMLAHPFKKYPNNFILDPKLDGYRCLIIKEHDEVIMLSRNGKQFTGFYELEKDFAKLPNDYVYDGEIVSDSFSGTQSIMFNKGIEKHGIFNLFDAVPLNEFKTNEFITKYIDRLRFIKNTIKPILQKEKIKNIKKVSNSRVFKATEKDIDNLVKEIHVKFVSMGYEGTMVKNVESVYQKKRTYDLQKIKDMDTIDLEVIDVFEGTSKYENMLGGVVVKFKDNEVRVGSGFTEDQRKYFWKNKNDIINKTIEIKYQEVTKNKNEGYSLRFPIFVRIREDKK